MGRSRLRVDSEKSFDRKFLSSLNFDDKNVDINRVASIYNRFNEQNNGQGLTREIFRDFLSTIFDLNEENIAERIFLLFGQGEKKFSFRQFLSTINLLLYADDQQRLHSIFRVYDVSADGNLQREEIFSLLRQDLPIFNEKDDSEIILNDFLTLILKKFDKDQDGLISFEDYAQTCQTNPTLEQCFGRVLPRKSRQRLIKNIFNQNKSEIMRANLKEK